MLIPALPACEKGSRWKKPFEIKGSRNIGEKLLKHELFHILFHRETLKRERRTMQGWPTLLPAQKISTVP
jgi:hypothetical protein